MASIVAYIELRNDLITTPSRFVLSEARRIADMVGATVYGLLTVGPLSHFQIENLAAEVSAAGADRILCSSANELTGPPLDITHGPLLTHVVDHLRPVLVLFPAGGSGTELGPPLAVRIGAAYIPNASLEVSPNTNSPEPSLRVVLTRWRAAHDGQRKIDIGDLERTVVATLPCGLVSTPLGVSYTEVEMIPCPEFKHSDIKIVNCVPDNAASLELFPTIVCLAPSLENAEKAAIRHSLPKQVGVCEAMDVNTALHDGLSPTEVYFISHGELEAPQFSFLSPQASILCVDEPGSFIEALNHAIGHSEGSS
jgi:hypothetical protein